MVQFERWENRDKQHVLLRVHTQIFTWKCNDKVRVASAASVDILLIPKIQRLATSFLTVTIRLATYYGSLGNFPVTFYSAKVVVFGVRVAVSEIVGAEGITTGQKYLLKFEINNNTHLPLLF
jgi:hypothetical protein